MRILTGMAESAMNFWKNSKTMKWIPYMSYWSCGYQGAPTEFVKNLHWLAAYYLKLNYGEVHLITDSAGAESLDFIEWSSVSKDLDALDPSLGKWLWAAGKLTAIKIAAERGKPFLHTDYDVFLPSGLTDTLDHAEVFAQSPEDIIQYNYDPERVLSLIPFTGVLSEETVDDAANVGVIGGTNVNFLHSYATEMLALAQHPLNNKLRTQRLYNHYLGASVLFEQYGLAVMAKKHGIDISYVFPEGWPTDERAKQQQYIHLMGAKKSPKIRGRVSEIVSRLQGIN